MPFTPTHILAVLPCKWLAGKRIPFSAFAIGAMCPDLPHFLPHITPDYYQFHNPLGPIFNCLPYGLAVFLLFQYVLKEPCLGLLPQVIRQRLGAISKPNVRPSFRFFVGVSIAIVIGAYTHVTWDSFSHHNRLGTRLFPILNETAFVLFDEERPFYKIIQHGSTVICLPILAILSWLWWRKQPITTGALDQTFISDLSVKWSMVAAVFAIPLAFAYIFFFHSELKFSLQARETVLWSVTSVSVLLIAYSGWIQHRAAQIRIEQSEKKPK